MVARFLYRFGMDAALDVMRQPVREIILNSNKV